MNRLLIVLLALLVIASDTYWFAPWIRPDTIFCLCCAIWKDSIIGKKQMAPPTPAARNAQNALKIIFSLFMLALILIDAYRGYILDTLPTYIIYSMMFMTFLIVEQNVNNYREIYFFILFSIFYNLFFVVFQKANIFITAGSLTGIIPGLGVERMFMGDTAQGLRVSGSFQSCIPLSLLLGILVCILVFSSKIFGNNKFNIFMVACCVWALLNTQTRSAILSLPVALLLSDIFISIKTVGRWKSIAKRILLLSLLLIVISFVGDKLMPADDSRLTTLDDTSSIQRYQINAYGVVGTLILSPWIGVSRDENKALEAIVVGFEKIGNLFESQLELIVTHHNEPAYYFRYYGIIGFTLYLLLYISIIRYIFVCKADIALQKSLLAMIIYLFLFNLMHNTKLVGSLFVWILLTMNAPRVETEPQQWTH